MPDRPVLDGKVAVVTGASRGVGKGIAEELAACGAAVYATGRMVLKTPFDAPCIPVRCDHTNDDDVRLAFERVRAERRRLDLLVNNVWGGYEQMNHEGEFIWRQPFWLQPVSLWDSMFSAGVRAHYVASRLAAPLMVERRCGLIVNISFWSAQRYVANVAYGVAKAATDKMTADMAHDLADHGVSVVSLYPGLVRTERVMDAAAYLDLSNSESPRFVGRAVAALAADPAIHSRSGSVIVAAECATRYGFTDIDGRRPVPLSVDGAL